MSTFILYELTVHRLKMRSYASNNGKRCKSNCLVWETWLINLFGRWGGRLGVSVLILEISEILNSMPLSFLFTPRKKEILTLTLKK